MLHQSDTAVSLSCKAVVNTWSHQRKRRRLRARLRQQEEEEEEEEDKGEGRSVEMQSQEVTTATTKEEQIRNDSNGEPSSVLKKGSPGLAQKQHSSRAELLSQLESLDTPCQLEFTSTVCVNTTKEDLPSPQAKRKKWDESGNGGESGDTLSLSLEWISGEDRDNLHQILQLIHNKLSDS